MEPAADIFTFSQLRKRGREAGVEEGTYRQSRVCRVLGNPVAFAVVCLLAEHKEMNPSEIARAVGRSVSRTSNVLAALKLAEIVRYEPTENAPGTGSSIRARCVACSMVLPVSLKLRQRFAAASEWDIG